MSQISDTGVEAKEGNIYDSITTGMMRFKHQDIIMTTLFSQALFQN